MEWIGQNPQGVIKTNVDLSSIGSGTLSNGGSLQHIIHTLLLFSVCCRRLDRIAEISELDCWSLGDVAVKHIYNFQIPYTQ